MKILFLLLVSLVALTTAKPGNFDIFFGKYAAVKMFTDCFGDQYMSQWTRNFTEALKLCNQEAAEDYLRDLPLDEFPIMPQPNTESFDGSSDISGNYGDINEENIMQYLQSPFNPYNQGVPSTYPQGVPSTYPQGVPGRYPQPGPETYPQELINHAYPTSAGIYNLPNVMEALQGNLTSPVLLVPLPYSIFQGLSQQGLLHQGMTQEEILRQGLIQQEMAQQGLAQQGFYRTKRQTSLLDADTINRVYQKIRNKAGNFTCIMKTLNYFDENFDVNVAYQMSQIDQLEIENDLKSDVFENMADCIRFASCRPLDRRSLMPPSVQRAIWYMKCENKMNLASCVKSDLMKNQDKFDTDALLNIPAGSDMDLGDKMLAILWGKFSRKQ